MKGAARYKLLKNLNFVNNVEMVYIVDTVYTSLYYLNCLNISMYAYIYIYILLGKVRTIELLELLELLGWANELLSKMWGDG